ncbi:DNA repair protein [Stenotrophomonas sp. LGBM10]|uniref:DNA repair protein n=1 Tax=Stenotrophomonas sp. LGBM10 TaxID=3390038 RepID=UPI00398B1A9E
MANGNFRLTYEDGNRGVHPAAKVRYRILQLPGREQVATGATDANGYTLNVDSQKQGYFPLTSVRPIAPVIPMKAPTLLRFTLQVWDYDLQQWAEPDLKPVSKPVHGGKNELSIGTNAITMAPVVCELSLQPYVRVLFQMQANNTPIASAPYEAVMRNKDGDEVAGLDAARKPVKGSTGKDGMTPRITCNQPLKFKFTLPGSKSGRNTELLVPLIKGQQVTKYVLGLKSQIASTEPKDGRTANIQGKVSAPAVLNPQAEEMLLLGPKEWEEFEALSGTIENTMAGLHRARDKLTLALQGRSPEEVKAAEKALGIAEDDVAKMLNDKFDKLTELQELVTFETYDKGRTTGNGGVKDRMGMRRRYIPKAKYEDLKRRRVKGIPIKVDMGVAGKVKAGNTTASNKAKHDPYSKEDFDRAKFMESLKKITTAAKVSKEVKTDPYVFDFIEVAGNEFAETVKKSESYEVQSSAQWLRFVAGAGASAEANWDPKKKTASVKAQGSASAKLVLLEAKWVHTYSVPSAKGWQMQFQNIDLGAIVFVVACELYGFLGAKASVVGSAELTYVGGKPTATPTPRDRGDSMSENFDTAHGLPRANLDPARVVPMGQNEGAPKGSKAGVEINAEVFAGIEGGIIPSGDLRWLPPDRREPVSFAKLSVDIAGSAGAGAKAQLVIYYAKGKFRIKAAARLCWGLGAKGAVDFAVDAGGMVEFVKWVYYQLAHAGFKALTYIAQDAFKALSQILFMVIAEDSRVGKYLTESFATVNAMFDSLQARLERAEARSKLVDSINQKPEWLVYATPETRGMLLYAITRHYVETHSRNVPTMDVGWTDVQVHALPAHKQAILNVMLPITTRPEWENVMQHMTIDGRRRADSGKAEGDVVRFLDYGWSLNNDLPAVFKQMNVLSRDKPKDLGNSYLQKYIEKRVALLKEFPRGYEVAYLNSIDDPVQLAALDGSESPTFAMMDPVDVWLNRDDTTMMA